MLKCERVRVHVRVFMHLYYILNIIEVIEEQLRERERERVTENGNVTMAMKTSCCIHIQCLLFVCGSVQFVYIHTLL